MLLKGQGKEFIEYYYEYLEKIHGQQIPLIKIAQRAKVKQTLEDYKVRCTQTTKAGSLMSRQAHMELAIQNNMPVNLGDVIMYVNNGEKASHGDVQKVPAKKYSELQRERHFKKTGEVLQDTESRIQLNCYLLNQEELENNPDLTGDYNVARAVNTFNKRIEPLLVVFKDEVRQNLIVDDPSKRGMFTNKQCELINGHPLGEGDQDDLNDVLTVSDQEIDYWKRRGLNPTYMYDVAEGGWENSVTELPKFQTIRGKDVPSLIDID
jgi:hypothetical protein